MSSPRTLEEIEAEGEGVTLPSGVRLYAVSALREADAAAYARGAEDMREAAAKACRGLEVSKCAIAIEGICAGCPFAPDAR